MTTAARTAIVVALVFGALSCRDDDAQTSTLRSSSSATTRLETTGPATLGTPPTTPAASTVPVRTIASDTTGSSATDTITGACPTVTNTDPVNNGFPMQISSVVGSDIRTGAHLCFERIVLELGGEGETPGYQVAYEDDPIKLSPSDQTVEIAGEATLMLRVAAWMTTVEGDGYQGPTELAPSNVEHVLELRMVENFEGMCAWAIGLDRERPFTVTTLTGPSRIVIDVATR